MKKTYFNPEFNIVFFDEDVLTLSFGDTSGEGGEIGWGDIDLDLNPGPKGDKYVDPIDADKIPK